MSSKYNGAPAIIKEQNPTAIFSLCGCHTLNLCGNDAAECILKSSTYFGTLQTICYSAAAPIDEKQEQSGLVFCFMAYLASNGPID